MVTTTILLPVPAGRKSQHEGQAERARSTGMKTPGELRCDLRCARWGHGSCTTSDRGVGISNCSCPFAFSRRDTQTISPIFTNKETAGVQHPLLRLSEPFLPRLFGISYHLRPQHLLPPAVRIRALGDGAPPRDTSLCLSSSLSLSVTHSSKPRVSTSRELQVIKISTAGRRSDQGCRGDGVGFKGR